MPLRQTAQGVERLLADHDQLAFEGILVGTIVAPRDDRLADHRHRCDHRLAQPVKGHRHIAPTDQPLPLLGGEFLELFDNEIARRLILREETHGNGIIARLRQIEVLLVSPAADQRVRDLQQNSGAVAQQRIGAHSAAMIEIGENLECLRDDRVRLPALDVGQEPHTAGIVLVARII